MQSIEVLLPKEKYQVEFFYTYTDLLAKGLSLSEIDYFFFPHSSEIIPIDFLEKYNCIGFHTGDLPNDRGGSPIQHKILRGEYFTKVSALKLTEQLDGGDVYLQRDIDLSVGNIETIVQEISNLVAEMVFDIISNKPAPRPQLPGGDISRRLVGADSRFRIEDLNHRQIYDRIRMLDGLDYPKASIALGSHIITLSEADLDGFELTFKCSIKIGDEDASHL